VTWARPSATISATARSPLPIALAFARGDEAERAFWRRTLEEQQQGPDDLAQAQMLLRRHGALDETMERARQYGEAARASLAGFPAGAMRDALDEVVAFCIARGF
jgi:octaprenyl-diphosphate synthase